MFSKSRVLGSLCVASILAASSLIARGEPPIQPVLVSGDWAPGLGAGQSIQGFTAADDSDNVYYFQASLSNDGSVALGARLQGVGVDSANNTAVFLGEPGALSLVVRKGDQVPGQPEGVVFMDAGFEDTGLYRGYARDGGCITVCAPLEDAGYIGGSGIWTGRPGSLSLVAWENTADPAGNTVLGPTLLGANQAGDIAFWTALLDEGIGGGEIDSLWLASRDGQLSLVAKTGQPAAPAGPGLTFDSLRWLNLNASGQAVIRAPLWNPTTSQSVDSLWVGRPGQLSLAAKAGDEAPGAPSGYRFGTSEWDRWDVFWTSRSMDGEGEVAFAARVTNGTDCEGVWRGTPGHLSLVALAGQQAAGTPKGTTWLWVDIHPPVFDIQRGDRIPLRGKLQGPGVDESNDDGLWIAGSNGMILLAREGEPAPGMPHGTTFGSIHREYPFFLAKLNAAGVGVFESEVGDYSGQSDYDLGIWSFDQAGRLTLLARTGERIKVGPGDHRTITWLLIRDWNDAGQCVFWARFSDGSEGLFLARIPGPMKS